MLRQAPDATRHFVSYFVIATAREKKGLQLRNRESAKGQSSTINFFVTLHEFFEHNIIVSTNSNTESEQTSF